MSLGTLVKTAIEKPGRYAIISAKPRKTMLEVRENLDPGWIERIFLSNTRIDLNNGSSILFRSSRAESFRGLALSGYWIQEFGDLNPHQVEELCRIASSGVRDEQSS